MKQFILIVIVLIALFLINYSIVIAQADPIVIPIATSTPALPWKDDKLFNAIGGCESVGNPFGKWDYHAKNKTSSASGVFQFINGSWYHYGREFWGEEFYEKNIWTKDNVELAWYVYKKYGTRDWSESKSCWQQK